MLNVIIKKLKNKSLSKSGNTFFLNPYSYLLLRNKIEVLNAADHICIDGQWLCHFLKWFGIANVERCSFDNSSLAPLVFADAEKKELRVSVVGSDDTSCSLFKTYLAKEYPALNIVYVRNGYFNSKVEIEDSYNDILLNNVDLLIVGMGAIKQEEYLINLKLKGWKGCGYTCGGFIHQTANKGHDYYPDWIDKYNLRFAYRIWDEPKLLRRYTLDYSLFVFLYMYDVIKHYFTKVVVSKK